MVRKSNFNRARRCKWIACLNNEFAHTWNTQKMAAEEIISKQHACVFRKKKIHARWVVESELLIKNSRKTLIHRRAHFSNETAKHKWSIRKGWRCLSNWLYRRPAICVTRRHAVPSAFPSDSWAFESSREKHSIGARKCIISHFMGFRLLVPERQTAEKIGEV